MNAFSVVPRRRVRLTTVADLNEALLEEACMVLSDQLDYKGRVVRSPNYVDLFVHIDEQENAIKRFSSIDAIRIHVDPLLVCRFDWYITSEHIGVEVGCWENA
jgi:hypothetical protein